MGKAQTLTQSVRAYGVIALRVMMGVVFTYAGVVKALDPSLFLSVIQGYRLVPYPVAGVISLYLPWIEIVGGISFIYGPLQRGAWWILLSLTWIFLFALSSAWVRGLDVSCGCFGVHPSSPRYLGWVLRDVLILVGIHLVPKESN